MAINAIVAEVSEPGYNDYSESEPPEEDGRPDGEPAPTTMNTPRMLPPWVHNQTLDDRSLLGMTWFVIFALTIVDKVLR